MPPRSQPSLLRSSPAALAGLVAGLAPRLGLGLVAGALVWLAVDSMRGAARAALAAARRRRPALPAIGGLWGEVADRARRALRAARAAGRGCRGAGCRISWPPSRLRPTAWCCSIAQGRIEWCNQTAAEQFGFDLQRDLLQQIANLVRDPAFTAYYNSGELRRTTSSSRARAARPPGRSSCRSSCTPTAKAASCCCRATSPRWSRPRPCGAISSPTSRTRSARRSRC